MKRIGILILLVLGITSLYAQQLDITGTVVDKKLNEPIIGVSVFVKGTTNGTITNLDGTFTLKNVSKGSTLVVSYIGYVTQNILLDGSKKNVTIALDEDSQVLDEVVVVGFGTQKKVNLTGAVSSVDSKVLASRPVSQVGQALQGVVPGLNLSTPDLGGQLGQTMSVDIRGTGTIGKGSKSEPLILIDGMEGNMNTLNPEDIENISVLKDASSSSIYGSRAAFGVILITTKKGKSGKMKVNYNNSFRYSGATTLPKLIDSYRFAEVMNETSINQGDGVVFEPATIERIKQYIAGDITTTTIANGNNWEFHTKANDNVDWYRTHFKWAWSQEHNLNLSGGSEKLQYYVSAGILGQDGNMRYGKDTYDRYNFTAKVNAQINKFVEFNINTKFIRYELDNPLYTEQGGLLYHDIARMWPTMPKSDPNGHHMRNGKMAQLTNGGRAITTNDNLYAQGQLVIHPLKNWNIYLEAGARIINQNKQTNLNRIYEYSVDNQPIALAYSEKYAPGATFARSEFLTSNFYNTSFYTDYTFEKKGHYAKVLLGMNTESYIVRETGAERSGVITDEFPELGAATGLDIITKASLKDWATAGFFARLNYVYKERYLVEANVRYDGSSRFLRDQRWNVFPSFSLGWNIARESFMEPINSIIGTLKPRVSWGMLGNQNTGDAFYPFYLSQVVKANQGTWLMNDKITNLAEVPGMVSGLLTWEKVYNTNIGLDISMFNNRLTGSFEYFIRKTKDMVGPPAEVGAVLGIGLPNTNNASLDNKGWEIQLNWQDRIGKVNYNVGFNLSDNRVKVMKYPNADKSLYYKDENGQQQYQFYDGKVLGEIWGFNTEGIAKTDQQMQDWLVNNTPTWGSQWGAGDIMYSNLDGKQGIDKGSSTLEDHGDLKVIGNDNPRFRFGLTLGADWKGIDLSMFFQGVMKRDLWLSGPVFWGIDGGKWGASISENHLDYFRPENTNSILGPNIDSYFPAGYLGNKGDKNKEVQSRYLQNGAYMRLKNLQIGYTFPKAWMEKVRIQNLRIFFSGDNLFTITKLAKTFDPEATASNGRSSGKTYPLSTTISFGLNVTL